MINGRKPYHANTPKLNTEESQSSAPVKLMSVTDMSKERVFEWCVEHRGPLPRESGISPVKPTCRSTVGECNQL